MESLLLEAAAQIHLAYANSGILAALASGLTILLRLGRLDLVQNQLPAKAKWDNLPQYAKLLIPFSLSLAGGLLMGLASKMPIVDAVVQAVVAGLGSIGIHHTSKLLGHGLDTVLEKKVNLDNPIRNAADLLFPKKPQVQPPPPAP